MSKRRKYYEVLGYTKENQAEAFSTIMEHSIIEQFHKKLNRNDMINDLIELTVHCLNQCCITADEIGYDRDYVFDEFAVMIDNLKSIGTFKYYKIDSEER